MIVFKHRYRKWCEKNNFESMLPEDSKKRKALALDKSRLSRQSSVTDHFGPEDTDAKPIPYSDSAFKTAAVEWLIETNQVRLVRHIHFSILSHMAIAATPDIRPSRLQNHARHRVPSQEGRQLAIAQAVKGAHPQDVQAATVVVASSPHGTFHISGLLSRLALIHCRCNISGPHCQRGSQSHM